MAIIRLTADRRQHRARSSVDRALPSGGRSRGFESLRARQFYDAKSRAVAADIELTRSDFREFDRSAGIDWVGLIDHLKTKCGFTEDRQLCQYMNIPSSTLSSVRRGKAELGMLAKFRLLERYGFHPVSEAAEILMTDEMAAKARRARYRQAQRLADKNTHE